MPTILSGANPYCTAQQFIDRYDVRTVGDLLSDDNTRLTPTQVLASGGMPPPGKILLELLQEAAGLIESATLMGDRYEPATLAALITTPINNSGNMLIGMNAGIAMFFLWDRRPASMADQKLPLKAEMAMHMLDDLRSGERIFGILEAAKAGNPLTQFMTPADLARRNFSSLQANRYFGDRADQFVPGQ